MWHMTVVCFMHFRGSPFDFALLIRKYINCSPFFPHCILNNGGWIKCPASPGNKSLLEPKSILSGCDDLRERSTNYGLWAKSCLLPVLCGFRAKNSFYSFKWLGEIKRGVFYDTWGLCELQVRMSINKVLLEHRHAHSFTCCLWLLSDYIGKVG